MGLIEIKMKKKAIIISIQGSKLSQKEKILLSKEKPWGVILFKRNLKSLRQIKSLILEIKKSPVNLKFKDYYENYKKFLRVISVEELKKKY